MLIKLILWAVVGYIVYSWFREKTRLNKGEDKTTIHHHHYNEGKKRGEGEDEDYIDLKN